MKLERNQNEIQSDTHILLEMFNMNPLYFDAIEINILTSCLLSDIRADILMKAIEQYDNNDHINGLMADEIFIDELAFFDKLNDKILGG